MIFGFPKTIGLIVTFAAAAACFLRRPSVLRHDSSSLECCRAAGLPVETFSLSWLLLTTPENEVAQTRDALSYPPQCCSNDAVAPDANPADSQVQVPNSSSLVSTSVLRLRRAAAATAAAC